MMNPTLGFTLLEKDASALNDKSVSAYINHVQINHVGYDFGGYKFSVLRVPLEPNGESGIVTINYDSVLRIKFIQKIFKSEKIDIIRPGDSLNYNNVVKVVNDTIDSICNLDKDSNMVCVDTLLYEVHTFISDTNFSYPDSTYINNFDQSFQIYYKTELVPVSPECGFIYQYEIDSIKTIHNNYLDSVAINIKIVEIPEDIYKNEPFHINLYF